ncbi:NAD(P)-dependent oxidoreductase [Alicyclobacillus suci]|uniref:NAD(P)-dependent oxidoreductase n=1 Tax=Alicyclobacillus suci TaxID=2816080 RepID=UPI001A9029B0|nr:NAD(P)-dependent oxidoreductase [Alicyclobacillus suci]
MTLTLGVVGLGRMGNVIARRLNRKYHVIGYDVQPEQRYRLREKGIDVRDVLKDLAADVDMVILSLPRPDISLDVVRSIAPCLRRGISIVETSTVLPTDVQRLHDVCAPYGIRVMDAAILGGISHVEEGAATLLVGDLGSDEDAARNVLRELSSDIRPMGTLGSGMAGKVINNAVAHSVMVLIVEAAALGIKLGMTKQAVYELLRGETALSRPLTHRFYERIMHGDYSGGMSTDNARKDSTLAIKLAQDIGVPLFSIQSTHTVYEIAAQEELANLDYASIATLWEKWAGIKFV